MKAIVNDPSSLAYGQERKVRCECTEGKIILNKKHPENYDYFIFGPFDTACRKCGTCYYYKIKGK